MHCPFCNTAETKVIDSRLSDEGARIRRRRECIECNERFTTYETTELTLPRVIKRDGSRLLFDLNKLRAGMMKALEKRPVSTEVLDGALQKIIHRLHTIGDREVSSQYIGELVMDELKVIDKIAYVRFASVYRSFQDVKAFHEEIQRLQENTSEKK